MSDGMLIVCGIRELGEKLYRVISAEIPGTHSVVVSGAEARRKTGVSEYKSVLIVGKLPDENRYDLASDIMESSGINVIVVVDRQSLYEAHESLDGTGVTILVLPITKKALIQSIRLLDHVKEGGTFEKAKLMLMQMKNFTEPQAHRYIQKISMDKRLPKDIVAQLVIKSLEKQ